MADGGFLRPDLEKELLGDIEGVSKVQVWREYIEYNDEVEYTMYFRDAKDEKRRVDFKVTLEEISANKGNLEDFVQRKARAAIMKEIDNG